MTYRTPDLAAENARLRGELAPLTYADALAACVGRFGPPAETVASATRGFPMLRSAAWPTADRAGAVTLYGSAGAVWIEAAHADEVRGHRWAIEEEGVVTPLPEALDDAAAWLAVRRAPVAPSDGGGL